MNTRLAAELPCIVGIVCAAGLAYAEKPWWMWGAFFAFACVNVLTHAPKE